MTWRFSSRKMEKRMGALRMTVSDVAGLMPDHGNGTRNAYMRVRRWFLGEKDPEVGSLKELAVALQCSMDDLMEKA